MENNNGTLTTTLRVGNYLQKKTGTTFTEEYHLYDHLGSTDVITDANGNALSRMAFDALGKRLQDTFASANSTANSSSTYKGYTGHDMLDHLGLIHMGGRVYDPDAGRFLSADLFVQAPGNSQSYNRYSYVLNNPLSMVDPSGYAGRSTENTAIKSDPIREEVVVDGTKAAEEAARYAQRWAENFAYKNVQAAIQLGSGIVFYTPQLAARLAYLDRWAANGFTGAARQAAKIRQQVSSSPAKNGAGLGLGGRKDSFASYFGERVMSGEVRDDIFDYGIALAEGGVSVVKGVYNFGEQAYRHLSGDPQADWEEAVSGEALLLYLTDDYVRSRANRIVFNQATDLSNYSAANIGHLTGRLIAGALAGRYISAPVGVTAGVGDGAAALNRGGDFATGFIFGE